MSAPDQADEILDDAGIRKPEDGGDSSRARIKVGDRNPVDIADEIVQEVLRANTAPRLFAMGGVASYVHEDGTLEPYDSDAWLLHVARLIDFFAPAPTERIRTPSRS